MSYSILDKIADKGIKAELKKAVNKRTKEFSEHTRAQMQELIVSAARKIAKKLSHTPSKL